MVLKYRLQKLIKSIWTICKINGELYCYFEKSHKWWWIILVHYNYKCANEFITIININVCNNKMWNKSLLICSLFQESNYRTALVYNSFNNITHKYIEYMYCTWNCVKMLIQCISSALQTYNTIMYIYLCDILLYIGNTGSCQIDTLCSFVQNEGIPSLLTNVSVLLTLDLLLQQIELCLETKGSNNTYI